MDEGNISSMLLSTRANVPPTPQRLQRNFTLTLQLDPCLRGLTKAPTGISLPTPLQQDWSKEGLV